MARLFGTDGVRGLANGALTAELSLDLAVAAAHVVAGPTASRVKAVVGRDPRASGEFLEAAVVAGLASAGVDVIRIGVVPTPAVAHLTPRLGAQIGVMLSASHNAMPDNGIKFFDATGGKLDDAVEDQIEAQMRADWQRPTGAAVGRVRDDATAIRDYESHLLSTLPHGLTGLRVVVDCANGAASTVSPEVLRRAGAEVIAIHATPDGLNINEGCGSTHLDDLRAAVVEHRADAGIAHDGDADRCLAIDAAGEVVDGDQILAILAVAMRESGRLTNDSVVATVMSNLGFRLAMQREGVTVIETAVGDRYVLEAMKAGSFTLGGEQSGHVVMLDHASTGDGVLTALHVLARMAQTGRSLADLASVMVRLPQVLVNVDGVDRARLHQAEGVARAVAEIEAELSGAGRVLLRPSGTEPLVRVMVEAPTHETAHDCAHRIAAVVRVELST